MSVLEKIESYLQEKKEESLHWEKYPKHFRYLPSNFGIEVTDSSIIKTNTEIFKNGIILTPNKTTLGKKRRKTLKHKEVKWGEFYVLNAIGTTLYKIGHSTNFNRRYRDLSASSPLPLCVVKYGMCDNPNILENYFHEIFSDKYFKNEWFSLELCDLELIESTLNKYFEI